MTLSLTNKAIEAEQAVLGAVFLDSSCFDKLARLEARDFSLETHQLIYKVMKYLAERDLPIDIVTVSDQFQRYNRVTDIGGVSYIAELASAVPTTANVSYYVDIVRSKALRRRGESAGNEIVALSRQDFESDEDYFSAVEDVVDELRPKEKSKMRSFADMERNYFDHLKSKAKKLKTGLFKLYDAWAQLWIGWLYVLAGRPGVGKTAKALMLVYGIAKYNPNAGPVLFYSQEMSEEEVIDRMVSMVAEVNYNKLINKGGEEGFTDNEWAKIHSAYTECKNLPIFVQDSSGVSIDEIRSTAKQFKKEYGKLAAVVVDYLQIMDIPEKKKGEMRAQAIGRVTQTAKNMARRMSFIFILLSQLDRSVDSEEPKLKHLRESGSIEQDADVVEFLYLNPDKQAPSVKVIDSIFAKGRNIGVNRFTLIFKWYFQKFVEVDPKEAAQSYGKKNESGNNRGGVHGGARKTSKRRRDDGASLDDDE